FTRRNPVDRFAHSGDNQLGEGRFIEDIPRMTRSMIMKRIALVLAGLLVAWLIALPFLGPRGDGQDKKRDEFAGDRVGAGKPVKIDGERAMGYLKAICDIGP